MIDENFDEEAFERMKATIDEMYGGDRNCAHLAEDSAGGGVRCVKCGAWSCY